MHRVEELLHELDDEHLLAVGLALHQPQPRVARRIWKLLEAVVAFLLVVLGVANLRVLALVALAHLLAQLLLLLLPPLRIELTVLHLRLTVGHLLRTHVLLVLVLSILVLVVLLRMGWQRAHDAGTV